MRTVILPGDQNRVPCWEPVWPLSQRRGGGREGEEGDGELPEGLCWPHDGGVLGVRTRYGEESLSVGRASG